MSENACNQAIFRPTATSLEDPRRLTGAGQVTALGLQPGLSAVSRGELQKSLREFVLRKKVFCAPNAALRSQRSREPSARLIEQRKLVLRHETEVREMVDALLGDAALRQLAAREDVVVLGTVATPSFRQERTALDDVHQQLQATERERDQLGEVPIIIDNQNATDGGGSAMGEQDLQQLVCPSRREKPATRRAEPIRHDV